MKRFILYLLLLLSISITLFFVVQKVMGQSCGNEDECKKLILEYEQKLSGLREQKNTLSSQIQFADTQIYLTTLRIQDTEQKVKRTADEIENLGGKIQTLNSSLNYISKLLVEKIAEGYKRRDIPIFSFFIDPDTASTMINRLKYAKTAEESDRRLAFQVQQAKLNFEEQKNLREEKKAELEQLTTALEQQKTALDSQKVQKQRLLADTQNDEQVYQNLLARARAEYAAIQGIISGAGTEEKLRDISKGEVIATVISTASCNSSGEHLHFTVTVGGATENPFNHLKSVDYRDNSGGDSWNPSGSWDWPVSPTISFNQGYGGDTWYVRTYHPYPFHNGIDIAGSSSEVHAVADGTLYRGSYSGNGGCTLPYVKITHKDSNITTFYLHVYSN